jgi:uncharacterized membrane protein YjjP (DUF1212 family)
MAVTYRDVAVSLGGEPPERKPVSELRYNAALLAKVHAILERVRQKAIEPAGALAELESAEAGTKVHPRWLVATALGLGAASLGRLLGADTGAAAIAGFSTGIGLLARKELGRRHINLLALPFAAAFIGALLGGLAIRYGWTETPALVVIVPALMLIPGPHLINGLLDLVDNYLPMSLARLGLATGITVASALGIVLGLELTLAGPVPDEIIAADHLNLVIDMILAGMVTFGFAVFYNGSWKHVGLAMVGGSVGHGIRYLALEAGRGLEVATFLGAAAVGLVCSWIARSFKIPFAVVAFAGAVTMMPGVQMYRGLSGAIRLANLRDAADITVVAGTIGSALQASMVVGALVLGLVVAARCGLVVAGKSDV